MALFCFALEGVGQECNSCYVEHMAIGWKCPQKKGLFGIWSDDPQWETLLRNGFNIVGAKLDGGTAISGQGVTTYEHKINNLAALGKPTVIGCGQAILFTDDGGIDYKYCQVPTRGPAGKGGDMTEGRCRSHNSEFSNSYSFRVQSADGVPLRFRTFEIGVRPDDIIKFSEVRSNGTVVERRAYGYNANKPSPGSILNPTGRDGYSHCRIFTIPNSPTPSDGSVSPSNMAFMIESGVADISWNVGYAAYIQRKIDAGNPNFIGSAVRAGWVIVIDVLSAKVKSISVSEVSECKPDVITVEYDVYVGAKNQNAKKVQFHIENEVTGLVLDTTVFNVNSTNNPNTLTFNSKRLGGAGNYKVRINSISDDWSTENVSSSVSGTVSLRVKPKPTVIIKDTTMCSGEMGAVVLKADGLDASYKFEVQAMHKSNNWVNIGTFTQMGRYELGVLEWDSNPNLQVVTNLYNTSYKYRVKVTNYDSYGIEQCNSGWYEYNVNVIKQPETGEQYHVPNSN